MSQTCAGHGTCTEGARMTLTALQQAAMLDNLVVLTAPQRRHHRARARPFAAFWIGAMLGFALGIAVAASIRPHHLVAAAPLALVTAICTVMFWSCGSATGPGS